MDESNGKKVNDNLGKSRLFQCKLWKKKIVRFNCDDDVERTRTFHFIVWRVISTYLLHQNVFFFADEVANCSRFSYWIHQKRTLLWRRPLMQLHVFHNTHFVGWITILHLHGFFVHDDVRPPPWHHEKWLLTQPYRIYSRISMDSSFKSFLFWPHDKKCDYNKILALFLPFHFDSSVLYFQYVNGSVMWFIGGINLRIELMFIHSDRNVHSSKVRRKSSTPPLYEPSR